MAADPLEAGPTSLLNAENELDDIHHSVERRRERLDYIGPKDRDLAEKREHVHTPPFGA